MLPGNSCIPNFNPFTDEPTSNQNKILHTLALTTTDPSTTEAEPGFDTAVAPLAVERMTIVTYSFALPIMNFLQGGTGQEECTSTTAMASDSPYLANISAATAMPPHSSVAVVPPAPPGMMTISSHQSYTFHG